MPPRCIRGRIRITPGRCQAVHPAPPSLERTRGPLACPPDQVPRLRARGTNALDTRGRGMAPGRRTRWPESPRPQHRGIRLRAADRKRSPLSPSGEKTRSGDSRTSLHLVPSSQHPPTGARSKGGGRTGGGSTCHGKTCTLRMQPLDPRLSVGVARAHRAPPRRDPTLPGTGRTPPGERSSYLVRRAPPSGCQHQAARGAQ